MKWKMIVDPQEKNLETGLQDVLHEHTSDVDLAHVWSRMAPLLSMSSSQSERGLAPKGHLLRWKPLPMAAMIAIICLLLLGAGGVSAYGFWWRWASPNVYGNPAQYTVMNQSQTANGLKVTVTRAYADVDRTIIVFDVTGPASWEQAYVGMAPQSLSLKNQETGASYSTRYNVVCSEIVHDGFPVHCIATFPALPPKAGTKTLTLVWDINGFALSGTSTSTPYAGQWHFQLTIPFLWQNHNPGQPQIQPAHT